MPKKKTTKHTKKKKNVVVKENTTTSTLPTTTYYINSWGYYNKFKKIIIEQITPTHFLYNLEGSLGIAEVKSVEKQKYLLIDGETYFFKKSIYPAYMFYNVPSLSKCEKFVKGKFKPRSYKEIQNDLINVLKQMFDFPEEVDIQMSSLAIGESWIKPLIDEFFFFGIDATKGGGKTTLGEIVYFLMRHGFVGGNISSASIPRLVDELDLNIFVDEIDQSSKDDDIMGILRKGQRRGNPYVRCEGRNNIPAVYSVSGCHGFSFRSEVEDAFMDRALRTHTTKSNDYMLPVINSAKKSILKALADELFFWFMSNILVVTCSSEKGCSKVSRDQTFGIYTEKLFNRKELYKSLVAQFSEQERTFLTKLFGRDNELAFLCLKTAKLLGFDMVADIKKILNKKKRDEASTENFYLEVLKEFIAQEMNELHERKLKDGNNAGCSFYPKSKLYQSFATYLNSLKVLSIGTKRFSSLLRDIGFVEGVSIQSQRYGNYPSACLIFTDEILKKLGLTKRMIDASKVLEDFEK